MIYTFYATLFFSLTRGTFHYFVRTRLPDWFVHGALPFQRALNSKNYSKSAHSEVVYMCILKELKELVLMFNSSSSRFHVPFTK